MPNNPDFFKDLKCSSDYDPSPEFVNHTRDVLRKKARRVHVEQKIQRASLFSLSISVLVMTFVWFTALNGKEKVIDMAETLLMESNRETDSIKNLDTQGQRRFASFDAKIKANLTKIANQPEAYVTSLLGGSSRREEHTFKMNDSKEVVPATTLYYLNETLEITFIDGGARRITYYPIISCNYFEEVFTCLEDLGLSDYTFKAVGKEESKSRIKYAYNVNGFARIEVQRITSSEVDRIISHINFITNEKYR